MMNRGSDPQKVKLIHWYSVTAVCKKPCRSRVFLFNLVRAVFTKTRRKMMYYRFRRYRSRSTPTVFGLLRCWDWIYFGSHFHLREITVPCFFIEFTQLTLTKICMGFGPVNGCYNNVGNKTYIC